MIKTISSYICPLRTDGLVRHSLISGLFVLFTLLMMANSTYAQLEAPTTESIYGGRINAISAVATSATMTRVYIATESANSVFYSDVDHSGVTPVFGTFHVVPDLDLAAGYGSAIQKMATDKNSGWLFFIHQTGLMRVTSSASSLTMVASGNINSLAIYDSYLFFVQDASMLHWGTIDLSTGSFTEDSNSPLTLSGTFNNGSIQINPSNNSLYLFNQGTLPVINRSDDAYNAFTSATTFSNVDTVGLIDSTNWQTFGIGPDGRLFLGGATTDKVVAYSDNDTNWTIVHTAINGVQGSNFSFGGTSASYQTYIAKIASPDRGVTWEGIPRGGTEETHPNDGAILVDPNDSATVYLTTDQGIGASYNAGKDIFEIDDGVEAVQVNDMDMDSSKNYAWIASKAGVRKVSNYSVSPSWSVAMFPNNDGSPYYSTTMDHRDTTGQTAYVGNLRVYKTTNGGTNWEQVFTAENAPYNYSPFPSRIAALEVNQYNPDQVFAGYTVEGDPSEGGLFFSDSAGQTGTWDQINIVTGSPGQDVDVNDILVVKEGADTVVYVGVSYDLSSPAGYSVYRITRSASVWTATEDMSASNTSTGTVIVVTIRDLTTNAAGDTIYAVGTDAGTNHPVAYFKPVGGLWTVMPVTGFPLFSNAEGRAVSVGNDTVYCAVGSDIYMIPSGGTSWALGYSYPVGTQINVLYYDELLVGTGTGLYGHSGTIPGPPSTFFVNQGWNLVSVPKDETDYRKTQIFPIATSNAFAYDGNGYVQKDTLENGAGYWLKFGATQGVYLAGTDRYLDTIEVHEGWNLVGSVSGSVSADLAVQVPSDIIESNYFEYNRGYVPSATIDAGKGYWVKASGDGMVIFDAVLAGAKTNSSINLYQQFSKLVIEDASGNKQELYFGGDENTAQKKVALRSALPPAPPSGIFDARFSTNRLVELANLNVEREIPIHISSAIGTVTISWQNDLMNQAELIIDGGKKNITANGSLKITNSDSKVVLRLKPSSTKQVPSIFALEQNYPNPFNPATHIRYQLPSASHVTLKVFNVLGQEVATLINGLQDAGYKSIEFNAANLPSGVYFYKLTAGEFSEVKRMSLLK